MGQEANRTPIVVAAIGAIGVIGAALLGNFDKLQIKSGSKLSQAPDASMQSSGSNSPNISAPNGEVRLNIDNSTRIGIDKSEPSRFDGEVGFFGQSAGFLGFLNNNDGKVVYLDNYFSEEIAVDSLGEDSHSITLWQTCDGLPTGQAPSFQYCTGTSIIIRGAGGSDAMFACTRSGVVTLLRRTARLMAHR